LQILQCRGARRSQIVHFDLPRPGDLVWIRQRRWRVERARRDRSVVRLDVASRGRRMTFLAPFDRPAAAGDPETLRRVRPQAARARLAHLIAHASGMRTVAPVVTARVDVLPHQLEPALAAIDGARRILIADDVGLGKTIQAGIVIAGTMAREPAARILVCVPAAVRGQWAHELADRFGVECLAADRRALDTLARDGAFGENPWQRLGVWLASLDFLKQPHVLEALPLEPWDLLVIDEAHGACGDSDRHAAASGLARRSRRVLLLTATPHSGDEESFRRLMALGRLDAAADTLTVFRRTRVDLGVDRRRAVRWHRIALRPAEARAIALLMSYEAAVLRAAGPVRRDRALLLLSIFRKRALSTMAALVESLRRRLLWLDGAEADGDAADWTQPRLSFDGSDDDTDDAGGGGPGLMADVGLDGAQERAWLRRLLAAARAAAACETKIRRVARLVTRAAEPVVVFTEFRDSLFALARRLAPVGDVALLHGGMNDAERARQLAAFLRGEASVLVATDVAGQGLNLQSRARWVISLELPWNPARLEQRVGRVDRIGQRRPVHFTLMVARGDAEAGLLAHVARRVLAARQALGGDLLAAVAPNEAQLRTALLDGAAMPSSAPAPIVPLCRRWRRAARTVARRLERSRALAAHWRGPAPVGGVWTTRPCGATGTRDLTPDVHGHIPALYGPASVRRAVLVFSVPLMTAAGDVVERHVVAVRVTALSRSSPAGARAAAIDAARQRAADGLGPRAARLTRLQTALAGRQTRSERAIAEGLLEQHVPAELQTGLFDRRGERALAAARDDREAVAALARDREARHAAAAAIRIGRPTLAIAWLAP
jgi:superfamily II DNA or RNA helicase